MLKIGEFSKLSRISIRMLRHYDEIGLLTPNAIDSLTGYRYYSEDQLPEVGHIAALRDAGFGLAAIGKLLREGDRGALECAMAARLAELRALSEETARHMRLLENYMHRLREDEDIMKYNVSLKTLPERYVASVRMTIPCYEKVAMLWQVMAVETAGLGLQEDAPCYRSVTYYDGEFKEQNVDAEAQKTVCGSYPDTQNVRFKTMSPVTFASTTFQGTYDHTIEANAAVAAWMRDNGYTYDGPAFNIYHVSPHETQNPEEYVTEVCYPVKKIQS